MLTFLFFRLHEVGSYIQAVNCHLLVYLVSRCMCVFCVCCRMVDFKQLKKVDKEMLIDKLGKGDKTCEEDFALNISHL